MEELFNMIANVWGDGYSEMYDSPLSSEMIENSVSRACEFFHVDEPLGVLSGETTGVGLGDANFYTDDILFYSQEQLADMGITGQDGLDLVMTHEGAHRMLQGIDTGFNSYQEELCCDYMAGVRAGLNGMDVTQLENSLIDLSQDANHPEGLLRVEAVEQGMAFAQEYMDTHGIPPTFTECLEDFNGDEHMHEVSELAQMHHDLYAEECVMEHYRHLMEREPDNEYAQQQYSESEARYQEIREFVHNGRYGNATGDYKDDSRPKDGDTGELKGFVDNKSARLRWAQEAKENAEWHEKRAKDAIARGDLSAARSHTDSAAMYRKQERDEIEASKKCTQ